ncbi:MAG: hypothetical protein HKN47_02890 [Pirellulaceae bacterium]|nr:hypothetical protein [Pirellulaceae bacterium]
MTAGPSSDSKLNSSVNLVRSSHSWTEADSAAGFVLRYLSPMRRQLASVLGSTEEADEALKLLLGHLVQAGFGEHKRGRLRDFLVRGIRSCAKARMGELPEADRRELNLDGVTLGSREWISFWRECLLDRAWRALERHEHSHDDEPVFSVLNAATADSSATSDVLAARIREEFGVEIDSSQIEKILPLARALFAQLIADEVVETLESPSKADVKEEIKALGMAQAFSGLTV